MGLVMRYALLNAAGNTVENVIVAKEGLTHWGGRTIIPLTADQYVPGGSTYSGGTFTPPTPPVDLPRQAARGLSASPSVTNVIEYLKTKFPEDFG